MIDSIAGTLMSAPISADGRPAAIDLHRLRKHDRSGIDPFLCKVCGMIAVVIYATSPMIRPINLGIRLVDADVLEAADAFGSTGMLKLVLVQLPLSLPTVMADVNQTIMISLFIVVVGVGGLGWLMSCASSITGLSFPSTALPLARDDPA